MAEDKINNAECVTLLSYTPPAVAEAATAEGGDAEVAEVEKKE